MKDPTSNADIRLVDRKQFLDFGAKDLSILKEVDTAISSQETEIIERLYDHLLSNPDTQRLLQDDETITRLKQIQKQYFHDLLNGKYDQDYAAQRFRIGMLHKRVGLDPQWYFGSYRWYLNELIQRLFNQTTSRFIFKLINKRAIQSLLERVSALIKAIFFDMGLAIDAYIQSLCDTMNERHRTMNHAIAETNKNLTEMGGNLERISGIVIQNAQNANAAAALAKQTLAEAENGGQSVQETLGAVTEIHNWVREIELISRRTNLIAINATIEAARAGEQGKGFMVVAKEVRELSENTQAAVQRISSLAENCLKVAADAGAQFTSMTPKMRNTEELVSKISDGSNQQSVTVVELATILDKLVNLTRTNEDEFKTSGQK